MKKETLLEGLNEEQKKAVTHTNGPLLIIAGAGTGKTTVITKRIAHLIMNEGVKGDEILALTFTNKAAGEMEERIDTLLPYGYVDLWVSTFHGFAQRILEAHALDIGLPADIELLDQTGQWLLVRENFKKFNLDYYRPTNNPTKFIGAMLSHFSKLKDEEITPEAYLEYAESLILAGDDAESSKGKSKKKQAAPLAKGGVSRSTDSVDSTEASRVMEIAQAYHTYQQLLLDNNKMDFGDLIIYTLRLLRERPHILKQYQQQFKYILVDEFQDTNWAQYDLVKMLALPQNNITVVADDDQSIYRFRGASMSNVIQFAKEFDTATQISLVQNYRSGQEILDISHDFIQINNPNRLEAQSSLRGSDSDRSNPVPQSNDDGIAASASTPPRKDTKSGNVKINKKLISATKETASIEHLHCKTVSDEARIVVETIRTLKEKDPQATWNDFAILVRANAHAREFEEALTASGIPHLNFSASGLYKTRLIADILSFFDLLDNYHESRAVFRMLNMPFLDIAMDDVIKLTHHASKKRVSLWSCVHEPHQTGITNEASLTELARVRQWLEVYGKKAQNEKPSIVLLDWLRDEGYMEYLQALPDMQSLEQFRLLRAFWDHLRKIEDALDDPRIPHIIETIRQEKESGEEGSLPIDTESGPEMVKVMTIHASKGLEFKYVFVTNMVDRRFPSIGRKDPIAIPDALVKEVLPEGDVHIEEERRLFYVAMTRAKKGLFFTSASNYGGVTKKKLSRFLHELQEVHEPFSVSTQELTTELEHFLPKKVQLVEQKVQLPIPKKFSFTQLRIFNDDPFEYKLQFIYKIPLPGKYVFSYGSSMHNTLQKFFQLVMERNNAQQGNLFGGSSESVETGKQVSVDELLTIFEQSWIDDWYDSAEQKKEYYQKGRKHLKALHAHVYEQGNMPQIVALERGFNLRVGSYVILGRVDRIDQLPDGRVRIVDYKTGNPKKKLSEDDKKQLLIYQIAAEEVFGMKVGELVYQYVDANEYEEGAHQLSFLGSDEEKKAVKEWIITVINEIHQSDFAPNPDVMFSDLAEYFRDLGEVGEL